MPKTLRVFLDESANKSLSRVLRHTEGRNIGMITGNRNENTTKENTANNSKLESDLRSAGYGFIKVKGRFIENYNTPKAKAVDENSYLVIGKKGDDKGALLHTLKNLGSKFKQDNILHKPHDEPEAKLHGTKEGGFPGVGETHNLGVFHPNRVGEFHTKMKGPRTFAFESVQSFKFVNPVTFFNRVETLF